MSLNIKSIIKNIIPTQLLQKVKILHSILYFLKARRIFEMADSEPAWLDINMLDYYQHKYPSLPLYGYDPASTEKRGKKCAKNLLTLIPRKNVNTFLELGC